MTGDEGLVDRLAATVTREWQTAAIKQAGAHRLQAEFRIAPHLNEKNDLVDKVAGIAYEMKVSPNNVHMEFYRHIFKAIVTRDNMLSNLKTFVSLVPAAGAARLNRGLGLAVVKDAHRLGLDIMVVGL